MSENTRFEKTFIVNRPYVIATKQSSFIGGVSNRILLPLGLLSTIGTFYITPWMIPIFFGHFIFEIVLHYALKITLTDLCRILWKAAFGKTTAVVRN